MIETIPITSRAEWLELRRLDVTASDVGAVCGVDPWRSALRIYAEKCGLVPPPAENNLMRRGRWLEPAVLEALHEERPTWTIKRAGVYLRDAEAHIGATPDAVAEVPERPGIGIVQCKVISRSSFEREWDGGGGIVRAPLRYELQTLTEAMLADAAWAVVAALVISTHDAELVVSPVERHAEAEQRIRNTVARFRRGIVASRPPPPDYGTDGDVIEALYAKPQTGLVVDLTGDNRLAEILADRCEIKAAIGERVKQCEALDAEIKAKLGEAEEATLPGFKVTWKAQTRASYVVPECEFRQLRITDRRAREDT